MVLNEQYQLLSFTCSDKASDQIYIATGGLRLPLSLFANVPLRPGRFTWKIADSVHRRSFAPTKSQLTPLYDSKTQPRQYENTKLRQRITMKCPEAKKQRHEGRRRRSWTLRFLRQDPDSTPGLHIPIRAIIGP